MSVGGQRGGTSGSAPAAPGFDTSKPNIARVYDVLLCGKDNYAADRELAEQIVALNPGLPGQVRDNRAFIIKAVTRAAAQMGIRQFIDLGAGLPTHPSVHEAVQGVSRDARVAYVDHDPVVQSHVRALLAGDGIVAVSADITRPAEVLADPELARVIDFGQPVCVILAAVLHFQPAEVARSLIAEYAAPMAAGSALVVSVFWTADEEFSREATRTYTAAQWHSHSPAELERWLAEAGLRPLRGHVGNVSAWPLDPPGRTATPAEAIGDLAEKLLRPGRARLPPSPKAQGATGCSPGSSGGPVSCDIGCMRKYVIMGIQGSGKGTHAKMLAGAFDLEHIAVGDIFRWNVQHHTKLGAQVRRTMAAGLLVGDDLVESVVRQRLSDHDWNYGFIIDGFPRNERQAEFFLESYDIDGVIHLDLPDAEVRRRVLARRLCAGCGMDYSLIDNSPSADGRCDACGGELVRREDDTEEALAVRLREYHEKTNPVLEIFRRKEYVITVDSRPAQQQVQQAIRGKLGLLPADLAGAG